MGLKQKSATMMKGGLTPRQILWLAGDRAGYEAMLTPWEFGADEADLIEEHGDRFLAEFVKANSGRRPFWFWDCYKLPEDGLRCRVGGTGDLRKNARGYRIRDYGVPIRGAWNLRGDQRYEGPHDGVPIDPDAPPLYESESNYLRRHSLFLPGEEKRLAPDAFEPVGVLDVGDWGNSSGYVVEDPAGPWPPTADWYERGHAPGEGDDDARA